MYSIGQPRARTPAVAGPNAPASTVPSTKKPFRLAAQKAPIVTCSLGVPDRVGLATRLVSVPAPIREDLRCGAWTALAQIAELLVTSTSAPGMRLDPESRRRERFLAEALCELLERIGWAGDSRPSDVVLEFPAHERAVALALDRAREDAEAVLQALGSATPWREPRLGVRQRVGALREFQASLLLRPRRVDAGVLTPREEEVYRYLERRWSYSQIAVELRISVETARSHARNIRRKLGVGRSRDLFVS
jgi:DNA-binding CsgD family transcriptional regulator